MPLLSGLPNRSMFAGGIIVVVLGDGGVGMLRPNSLAAS